MKKQCLMIQKFCFFMLKLSFQTLPSFISLKQTGKLTHYIRGGFMQTTIICIGKLKEQYLQQAQAEYTKRLGKFTYLNIIEQPDEKIPDNPSQSQIEIVKNKEADKIIKKIQKGHKVIPLAPLGKKYTSEGFAKLLNDNPRATFVIGGSVGLANSVLDLGQTVSFSDMTFPHQLMRVILLEQIYRGYKIINNEPYHK
jgi:23S rRNA (pseudouridine1915-N3)-methyltransferase